ncbi:MAG: CopG family transcriptional regulator [Geminicoccaceae bacterium]
MVDKVHAPRPEARDREKITVNLGDVDLGRSDLPVAEGCCADRTDFIRTAVRQQLDRHGGAARRSVARKGLELGLLQPTRQDLKAARAAGEMLHLRVPGLASIAANVTPDLATATIASATVPGVLHASPAVKAALADRTG